MKDKAATQTATCALYVRPVLQSDKAFFKAECARRGITMQEAVSLFMKNSPTIIPQLKKLKGKRDEAPVA